MQSINARTVAERAAAASAAVMAQPIGRDGSKEERDFNARAASQKIFAQATVEANNALRDTQEALKTAGLSGYSKSLAEINLQIEKQIELNPENADTWRKVGAAEKEALDLQTRKALFQGQQDNLAVLSAEASAVGKSDDAYRELMATVQAKIELERQGIAVTSAAGKAYVDNAKKLSDFNAQIERTKAAWDEAKQAGGQAIDDIVANLGKGSTGLKSAAADILKTVEQLALSNPLKNLLLGQHLPTIADLFTHVVTPSLSIPGLGSLGSASNPMYVVPVPGIGGLTGQGGGILGWLGSLFGSGAANDNVPLSAAAKAVQSIESGGNYSALGPLLSSGDRAYGAYQIMGANIGPWTKSALGYSRRSL